MAVQTAANDLRVVVVPITHTAPSVGSDALEIPPVIKRHLGLDDERSWVILNELNVFNWPGPDLRPVASMGNDTAVYGMLPSGFFRRIRDQLVSNIRAGKIRQVPRTK